MKMKKAYQKPMMEMEAFTPNEYIAACYAIVDATTTTDQKLIKIMGKYPTDGQNKQTNDVWNWLRNGFEDDNLDKLEVAWTESHNGWFYNGSDMNLTTEVSTWEANGDTQKGQTQVKHMAIPVDIITLGEEHRETYGDRINAS